MLGASSALAIESQLATVKKVITVLNSIVIIPFSIN
tara:strand:- start:1842 stop:1949 length:108 start_codon:yes stop_codon:yes gene_type:complete